MENENDRENETYMESESREFYEQLQSFKRKVKYIQEEVSFKLSIFD